MTDTSRSTLPPRPVGIRTLTNDESKVLVDRFPDTPRDLNHCPTCRGRKVFRWYADGSRDLADVVEYECPCADQWVSHRMLLHSGIYETYQRLGWLDLAYSPQQAIEVSQEYLTHSDGYINAGFGVVLCGDKGTGKTLLATLMLKHLRAEGYDVYSTTFASMLDMYAGGWRDKAERSWFDSRVRNAGVLLIDDLGRERNKGVGTLGENAFEEVVRHRVARSKPTFLTTNLTLDQIQAGYGGHSMSLLSERSATATFIGEDRRGEMRLRFATEIRNGLTRPVVFQ